MVLILAVDVAGTPTGWLDFERAAYYYAKQLVAWEAGEKKFLLRGGWNARTGDRSELHLSSILAVRGDDFHSRHYGHILPVSKELLVARDRNICGYCAQRFRYQDLEVEHIVPKSRGGGDTWMNLVAACRACNSRKDNRTPEEAKMALIWLPYAVNRHEATILQNRRVLADQAEFLMAGVPKHSRLWTYPVHSH
jgi:HNH endonuclease